MRHGGREHRLPPAVQPEPLVGVSADEAVERAVARARRVVDPRARGARRRAEHLEDVEDVLAGLVATGRGDDERRTRDDAARAAGARSASAGRPRNSTGTRGARELGTWSIIIATAPAAPEHRARPRAMAPRASASRTPEPGPRGLPEAIEPADAQALGHDEQLDVARDGARREVPVARVRRRHDDPPPVARAPPPSAPATPRRCGRARAPRSRARASQRSSTADAPSDAYIARACPRRLRDPRRARIAPSTCARRMRRTLPRATRERTPTASAAARHGSQRRPRRRSDGRGSYGMGRALSRIRRDGRPCPPAASPSKATA